MKKSIIFLGAAALVMLAACNKEVSLQVEPKGLSLDATVEQQVDPNATKTALDGTSVVWAADDAIKVFDEAGKAVKLTADAAGTSAHFTQVGDTPDGFNEAGALYAIYPHDAATGASGSTITFTLPATQTYVADSFDPACNVSVGEVVANAVTFKNTCGILKLQLTGIVKVGKIELTSKTASQNLYGTFTVNATAAEPAATYSTGGGTTLTLDCPKGVQLDRTTAKAFYFVVPAGCFGAGFEAIVYDIYDSYAYSCTIETASANTIARTRIKAMPSKKVSLINGKTIGGKTYTEASHLHSTGKWIDTGVQDLLAAPLYGEEFSFAVDNVGEGYRSLFGNGGVPVLDYIHTRAIWNKSSLYMYQRRYDLNPSLSFVFTAGIFYDAVMGESYNGETYGVFVSHDSDQSDRAAENTNNLALYNCSTDPEIKETTLGISMRYFRILSGTKALARYFIPCTNGSSVPGMLDLVNGVFYEGQNSSEGTGVFTAISWD